MEIDKIYNWICIILGLLVLGEAIALIIGMNLSGSEGKEWLSLKNYIILIFDIISGLLLVLLSVINFDKKLVIFILIILISISFSHLYRDIEYFTFVINKFCHNFPLFVFNNIKLILSLLCVGINVYILIIIA